MHLLHIIEDSHKYREPIASGLGKKAIVTNREFLQAPSLIGLVTVVTVALLVTAQPAIHVLHRDMCPFPV
jgi:hypothetical protein